MAQDNEHSRVEEIRFSTEYTVVDAGSLAPVTPGPPAATEGPITWSVTGTGGARVALSIPRSGMELGSKQLAAAIRTCCSALETEGRLLLPGSMHPSASDALFLNVDPRQHQWAEELFNTRSHGYANARGTRLELPVANEDDFGKLHTAIRMVLPLIPAISAASPFIEGQPAGTLSARSALTIHGLCRIPELIGSYIPEVALDQVDHYRIVLEPIALALAERGLSEQVDYHQVNRRAAVPAFDRNRISITVADVQECAGSDLAVAEMTMAVIGGMKAGRWVSNYLQRAWHETDLLAILRSVAEKGSAALIANRDYLLMFGNMRESATAGELWRHLYQQVRDELSDTARTRIAHILDHGSLAERILRSTGERPSLSRIKEVYRELAACLKEDRPFS